MEDPNLNPAPAPAPTPTPEPTPAPAPKPTPVSEPTPAPAPEPTPVSEPTPAAPVTEPAPAPAPEPAAAPIWNNPAQDATPQGSSLTPTPGAKNTHGALIAIIIVAIVLIVGGIVAAVLLIPKGDDKKEDTTSKEEKKKEEKKEEGSGGGSEKKEEGKSSTSSLDVTFDGFSFTMGETFGDNAKALAKAGTIYTEGDNFDYVKLTDLDSYLNKTYNFGEEDSDLPTIYLTKDPKSYSAAYIVARGVFWSTTGEKTKKYSDLQSYVALWCEKDEKMTIGGKSFQCGKTKGADIKSAYSNAELDYGNYEVKIGKFDVSFMIDEEKDVLEEVMISAEYSL